MKISVILACLNEERYIRLPLQSLQKQSFTDFETILVDAGSKDKTVRIAKEYGPKIIVIPNARSRGGIAYQRNIGAKEAQGEILAFTEADTVLPNFWLEKIIEKFEDKEIIAIAGAGFPYDAPFHGVLEYQLYNRARLLFSKAPSSLKRFMTSGYNLAVRKKAFKQSGGFPLISINEDGFFGKKLATMGKTVFCCDIPVYISARRLRSMGFINFNTYYLFMLENILPSRVFRSIREKSAKKFYER